MTTPIRRSSTPDPRVPRRLSTPAATSPQAPADRPAAPPPPSAGAESTIANQLGTGNLPALDLVLDKAASAADETPPPPSKTQLALKKALAGDAEALAAIDALGPEMYVEREWTGPSIERQLVALLKAGKTELVREVVKDLADSKRLEARNGAGAPLGRLAYEQPGRFVAAMANMSRNGFALLPGGEKVLMTPGPDKTFGDRLASSARLVSPQQSVVKALAATRDAFYTRQSDWEPVERSSDRRIEADAYDVNAMPTVVAAAQVRRNAQAVTRALAKLTPGDRSRYEAVAATVAKQPTAVLSLQAMLLGGRLPGATKAHDGRNLLEGLETLAKAPLHADIDRADLLADVIQEAERPDAINQHNRGCCTMASLQIKLTKENPAEAVRLVTGLASPEGKVTFANGDMLEREPGTETSDGSDRSISARLFQPAMMEYANGDLDYDNAMTNKEYEQRYRENEGIAPDAPLEPQDLHSDGHGGLGLDGVHRALNALSGGRTRSFTRLLDAQEHYADPAIMYAPRGQLMTRLQEGLKMGMAVPVGMNWGSRDKDGRIHGGHEVLVTGLEGDRVRYINPWGQQESMPLEKFAQRTDEISVVSLARLGR